MMKSLLSFEFYFLARIRQEASFRKYKLLERCQTVPIFSISKNADTRYGFWILTFIVYYKTWNIGFDTFQNLGDLQPTFNFALR